MKRMFVSSMGKIVIKCNKVIKLTTPVLKEMLPVLFKRYKFMKHDHRDQISKELNTTGIQCSKFQSRSGKSCQTIMVQVDKARTHICIVVVQTWVAQIKLFI